MMISKLVKDPKGKAGAAAGLSDCLSISKTETCVSNECPKESFP